MRLRLELHEAKSCCARDSELRRARHPDHHIIFNSSPRNASQNKIINTAKSKSSLATASICLMSENVAPGPRRGGRERTSTQRYQGLQQHASSTTSKRKRSDTTNTAADARPKKSLKSQDQVDAAPRNSKSAGKRVTTNRTVNSDNTRAKTNAKTTTKSRLDGPAKDAGNFVDLTEDDDEAVSSSAKKSNRTKSQKGEEKRLKP